MRPRSCLVLLLANGGVFAFARRHEGETLVVALNANEHAVHVEVPVRGYLSDGAVLSPVVGEDSAIVAAGRTSRVQIGAVSGVVWQALPRVRGAKGPH